MWFKSALVSTDVPRTRLDFVPTFLPHRSPRVAPLPGGGGGTWSDDPPPLNAVLRATVREIKPYGVFVQMEGFRRNGLVPTHQAGRAPRAEWEGGVSQSEFRSPRSRSAGSAVGHSVTRSHSVTLGHSAVDVL